ncbi:MAG: hypothetical protein M1832_001895 [Thelocarpon impressellum]|nr:MAG: hypothetical protein M1832_001895 [Thelocarpon impressellum]
MAANEYYQGSQAYRLPPIDFHDQAPPPPPASEKPLSPSKSGPASVARPADPSPFDDYAYATQAGPARDNRPGAGGDPYHQNPFADDVPLREYPSPGAPGGPKGQSPQQFDPALESGLPPPDPDVDGRKKKSGKRRFNPLNPKGRTPWFVYIMTLIQITVFIVEIAKNSSITGSPIAIKPSFNPMIGPSNRVLIYMGARYMPCMRSTKGVQDADIPPTWPCPNTTTTDQNSTMMKCTLSQVCGFGGVPEPKGKGSLDDQPQPNQWYRFIIPIFLHAGIIHISFNMLLQLTLGRDIEKLIGPLRFALVYFSSGIFGFVLGGNYAASGQSSSGASGCLFGVIALILLDLLYTWKERKSPFVDLAFIILDMAVSFVLGLLPGLDNFSHIGGFLMGLGLGICLLHSPNALRQRIGEGEPPYYPLSGQRASQDPSGRLGRDFVKRPVGFFKGRKPLWWAWWLIRAAALIAVLVAFIVLLNNFYKYRNQCSWCKYLSCLPVKKWCDIEDLQIIHPN